MSGHVEDNPPTIVMLSADQERVERVWRLCARKGRLAIRWTSDPALLRQMLPLLRKSATIAGIILDLTPAHREDATPDFDEASRAWYIAALVTAGGAAEGSPFLVVSDHSYVEAALRKAGMWVSGRVAADAGDHVWHAGLTRLLASGKHDTSTIGVSMDVLTTPRRSASSSGVVLRPGLVVDLDTCVLFHGSYPTALSAREAAVLGELLRASGHYLSASDLAHRLTHPGAAYPVDEHSVEQTICGLRRKLGESARHPHILLNKRGLGYALIPQHTTSMRLPSPPRENLNET